MDEKCAVVFENKLMRLTEDYGIAMTGSPVSEIQFLRLPARALGHWGDWLNVVWDVEVAINLLAADHSTMVDGEECGDFRILQAGADAQVCLGGVTAALIICPPCELLDKIAILEEDYGLPRGVASRRHPLYNLGEEESTIYVEQNPALSTMANNRRVLKIGNELFSCEGYTTTPPYTFHCCLRGIDGTTPGTDPVGFMFGLLGVSEFGATSVYIDQNSSLQDEVPDEIANIWDAGFQFFYFDGSGGENPPFWHHVANAQYREFRKLRPQPILAEGAAKTHFSWDMLAGGRRFTLCTTTYRRTRVLNSRLSRMICASWKASTPMAPLPGTMDPVCVSCRSGSAVTLKPDCPGDRNCSMLSRKRACSHKTAVRDGIVRQKQKEPEC